MILQVVFGLLAASVAFLYTRWTRRYGTLERMGIPVKKPFLCFGSGPWALHKTSMKDWDMAVHRENPDALTWGFYEGSLPVIHTIDPEVIKEVYVKQFDHFQLKLDFPVEDAYKTLDLTMGEVWSTLRKRLTPVFTSGKIKGMIEPIDRVTHKMVRYLERETEAAPDGKYKFESKLVVNAVMIEIIAKVGFGLETNVVTEDALRTDSEFHKMVVVALVDSILPKGYVDDFFNVLFQLEPGLIHLALGDLFQAQDYCNSMLRKVVKHRDDNNAEDTGDFIDIIRKVLKEGQNYVVPQQVTIAQGAKFLFAGFDLPATTLVNTMHMLSKNPDIQQRLHEDVCAHAKGLGDITYETVGEMKYLEACIFETLRHCTPLLRNQRLCTKDITVKGMHIQKGMRVDVPVPILQHHPEFYGPDAEAYNPDRFFRDGHKISDIAFHTFGLGPRQCLGMRFALTGMKLVLAKLVHTFKVLEIPGSEVKIPCGNLFTITVLEAPSFIEKRHHPNSLPLPTKEPCSDLHVTL